MLSSSHCDSLLRRTVSQQCSSTNSAPKTESPINRWTALAPSTTPGKRKKLCPESGLRPCRFRPPSAAAILLAFVVPSFLLLLMGTIDGTKAMPNEWEEQRMCGRLLIRALKMVCNHQYAQPNRDHFYETTGVVLRVRRSPAPRSYVVKRHRQPTEPTTASHKATGRNRRGIIWECCTNKCSLNYIRNNYCAAPPSHEEQTEENSAVAAFQLEEDARRRRR